MNKLIIALFGITGLSVLTPAMAHADSLSISFSSGYPVYAAPVTTYHYVDYRPQPNAIVVYENNRREYREHGHQFGYSHDRRYDRDRRHHEHHERCGHAERERHEYRHNDYRDAGHGYSGYNYQPAPVIKRIETNPRLYR